MGSGDATSMKCYGCDGVGYIPAYDLFASEVEYFDTIEFYPGDPCLSITFLCWYLLIEKRY